MTVMTKKLVCVSEPLGGTARVRQIPQHGHHQPRHSVHYPRHHQRQGSRHRRARCPDQQTNKRGVAMGRTIKLITVDEGALFKGTLKQFADCFFSNPTEESIRAWVAGMGPGATVEFTYEEG